MILRFLIAVIIVFTLTACGGGGKNNGPEITSFSIENILILNGEESKLSWTVKNVDSTKVGQSITITSSTGESFTDLKSEDQIVITPNEFTQYTITVTNGGDPISKTIDIYVGSFKLLQEQILKGQTTRLIWDIKGIESISISPEYGDQLPTGGIDLSPKKSMEFSLFIPELFGDSVVFSVMLEVKDPVELEIIASPEAGLSPFTVRFSPLISNNNIVISSYEWDFDGDDNMDVTDTFGAPRTYTYTGDPGQTFTAKLTAIPAQGEAVVATKLITIENNPPIVNVSSNATNGHAPLDIRFTVSAQDSNGLEIVKIDFNSDGIFDEEYLAENATRDNRTFSTTYDGEGQYKATVQVVDQYGAMTLVANNAINVDVNNPKDPIISMYSSRSKGNAPFSAILTAGAATYDDDVITKWEWDLDGDGVFEQLSDETGTSDTQSIIYSRVDNYYPVVKVTTSKARSALSSIKIESTLPRIPPIDIPNDKDTINIDASEISEFTITSDFTTDLEVWIEDLYRTKITTIQQSQKFESGDFLLSWDGIDSNGKLVSEGDYYVMYSYTAYGQVNTVDLRETTGGKLSYYRRVEDNPRQFERLESPLIINYEVDNPAEVSFFWQISFGDRLMTLMEHERLGRGAYSLYWNGEFPSGKKVADGTNLMPGIVRYDLPNNVIFVKETPRIENYQLKSTVIADPRREPIGIDLTLSKASTVEIVVSDMEKGVDVATRVHPDLVAGEQKLSWDGKNNNDQYLSPGDYRVGVRSVDDNGDRSMFWYRTQQIQY